jgi:hypothetical protein
MGIQIITSSVLASKMFSSFEEGLDIAGWDGADITRVELDGKYDNGDGAKGKRQDLYKAMDDADSDADLDVVVAAGGLVAAHAANKVLRKKPFLVLVGSQPTTFALDNPMHCGGVNLDMVQQTNARRDELCKHYGLKPEEVCLLWNQNSKMGSDELAKWGKYPNEAVADNTNKAIRDAFDNIRKKNLKGVVISGDPFFTGRRNAVVEAAQLVLITCYPFMAYLAGRAKPAKNRSMVFGPDLDAAYRTLGTKAGAILSGLDPLNPPKTGMAKCPVIEPIFIGG